MRAGRESALKRSAPILLTISLGLGLYFMAKEVLFLSELHALRPAMMSLAMTLLATLTFNGLKNAS
ncbi:MAG: hypothetical protein GYB36_01645 [Alphaproteobacteria bacterium]|nr:hypothetical protein [Alphaproteobacteria bacterium]